ncbi:DUF2591 domain-containing protein [Paraburkholderia panacisoli]|uniref:DUF2591 domain-containing protein n=1 Tax=Paraburkholderia panacisoli TaxID=2603818 RepID=A0A5B0G736_9BURK|nr:phage protein NinX family protein [Paraburkholderia panacisoli]KAA0999032.1 DUF2591 domain-containing protein [Paraburkholderia panacisoli]
MKTNDLEGAQLDYWVAKAEGLSNPKVEDGLCRVAYVDCDNKHEKSVEVDAAFSPSTDWAQGGPIIEREDYCLPRVNTNAGALHHGGYAASTPAGFCFYGNTPLIAAMRAYVADKFGDEVPDEI